jgi:hypothetical protein
MYLFSRQTRLAPGQYRASSTWALEQAERATRISGLDVGLWASVFGPGVGTIGFTAWVPDLEALEQAGDKLAVDEEFISASDQAAAFVQGGFDDSLLQVVHGEPDPERQLQYVGGVRAVLAEGAAARGIGVGVEIAQMAERITGLPTLFCTSMTGPYGGVAWLTGYEDIAAVERASQSLVADPAWLELVDRQAAGAFAAEPALTTQSLYRRLL